MQPVIRSQVFKGISHTLGWFFIFYLLGMGGGGGGGVGGGGELAETGSYCALCLCQWFLIACCLRSCELTSSLLLYIMYAIIFLVAFSKDELDKILH